MNAKFNFLGYDYQLFQAEFLQELVVYGLVKYRSLMSGVIANILAHPVIH